jgi:hypothetical protein
VNAYRKLNKAKDIFQLQIYRPGIIYSTIFEANVELREEKFDSAKVKFLKCLHLARGTYNHGELFCLERLADIGAWPASEWDIRWPVMYCGHAYKSKDKVALHKALLFLGDVFLATKYDETATNLYIVALEGFTHMDIHHSRAQCMVHLGDLASKQGHTSKAINFWTAARPLFERSLQVKDVAQIDARLSTVDKTHQKSFLQLPTLSVLDWSLTRGTSEVQEVEIVCLNTSPEGVLSTSQTTSC